MLQIIPQKESTFINKVEQVLFPINVDEPFKKGCLVYMGNGFGIVIKKAEKTRIKWWKDNNSEETDFIFEYDDDALQALKVKPLPLFVPGKTFLVIPKGTQVQMENGDILIFSKEAPFWLKDITDEGYLLVNPNETWLFPLLNFPGKPVACVWKPPSRAALEASNRLDMRQLWMKAEVWLKVEISKCIVNHYLEERWVFDMYQSTFKFSLFGKDYLEADFQIAWKSAVTNFLLDAVATDGIRDGVCLRKKGDRVWEKETQRLGTIECIDILRPTNDIIYIAWDDGSSNHYSFSQMEQRIFKIEPHQIVDTVWYWLSENYDYFVPVIGFNNKENANSWARKFRRELGEISKLYSKYDPKIFSVNPTNCKYFYFLMKWKYKTHKTRMQHLEVVASWNLSFKCRN